MIPLISLAFLICTLFSISSDIEEFQVETKPQCCPSCLLPLCLPTIDICIACPLLSCCRRSCQIKICVPGAKICLGCLFDDAISLNDVEKDRIELNFDDSSKEEESLIITHHAMMTEMKEEEEDGKKQSCCHPSCKIAVCAHNTPPICRECENALLQTVHRGDEEESAEEGKKSCCARSCKIKYCREHNKICMGCNQKEDEHILVDDKFLRSNQNNQEEEDAREIRSPASLLTEALPQSSKEECCPHSCKVKICRPQFMLCAVCEDEIATLEEGPEEALESDTSCCQDSCKVKICQPDSIVCMNCEVSIDNLGIDENLLFTTEVA